MKKGRCSQETGEGREGRRFSTCPVVKELPKTVMTVPPLAGPAEGRG
jgi:hypothetical protein